MEDEWPPESIASSTLQRHCTENSKQIFPVMKLRSQFLHSCICERLFTCFSSSLVATLPFWRKPHFCFQKLKSFWPLFVHFSIPAYFTFSQSHGCWQNGSKTVAEIASVVPADKPISFIQSTRLYLNHFYVSVDSIWNKNSKIYFFQLKGRKWSLISRCCLHVSL